MNAADLDRKALEIATNVLQRGFDWQAYLVYRAAMSASGAAGAQTAAAPAATPREVPAGPKPEEDATEFSAKNAEDWVAGMKNSDGTVGAHWTLDQAKQIMARRGIPGSPTHFWVALNLIYSDYGEVLRSAGCATVDLYAGLARAFLEGKDAAEDKLARYYKYISG